MGGLSATSQNFLVLGDGAYVTVGGVDMGALSGESSVRFWTEMTTYHPDIYGAKGEIKGTGHDVKAVPKMSFTFLEIDYLKFQELWNRIGTSSDASSEKIGDGTIGRIADANYQEVIVTGAQRHDLEPIVIILDQAYISNNPDFSLSDRTDTMIEVELTGVYLATAPHTFPAQITIGATL